jgi:hypothetical protein
VITAPTIVRGSADHMPFTSQLFFGEFNPLCEAFIQLLDV